MCEAAAEKSWCDWLEIQLDPPSSEIFCLTFNDFFHEEPRKRKYFEDKKVILVEHAWEEIPKVGLLSGLIARQIYLRNSLARLPN